jgi:hypothetical protein
MEVIINELKESKGVLNEETYRGLGTLLIDEYIDTVTIAKG